MKFCRPMKTPNLHEDQKRYWRLRMMRLSVGLWSNLVKLLQDGGYRAVEAKDAEDALSVIATSQSTIDLVLTDVILPGKSGAELMRQAKQSHPKIRSLFMSGYTGDLVSRQGLVVRESSFLEKPFTKRSLYTKVYAALHNEDIG